MELILSLFGIERAPGTALQLWWETPSESAAFILALVLGASALGLAIRSVVGISPARQAVILTLRTLGLALLAALLLKPAAVLLAPLVAQERLAILVDQSQSMSVAPTRTSATRWQDALAAFSEDGPLSDLQTFYELEFFSFTSGLSPMADPEALGALSPDGEETDIGAALGQLVREGRDLSLGGVLLVSDGIDRGPLRRAWKGSEGATTPDRAALAKGLEGIGLPIHTLALGSDEGFVDLAIDELEYNEFAFLRQPTEVKVSLRAVGLEGRQTQVSLSQGGRTLGALRVTLPADGEVATVSFPLDPEKVGKFTYTLSTPVLTDEAVKTNNTRSFTLKVVRDRIRVLQIVGAPSWDEKFLRRLLKTDPNVDLVSFFILRTGLDARPFDRWDYSLIEFPHQELFDTELHTFDLVIFQNFNYAPYFERDSFRLLGNLAEFVRQGGGMAVIGGEKAFAGGDYGGTPLEEVLPVLSDLSPSAIERSIPFTLTADGARHPVTALHFDPAENLATWSGLPPMDGFNPVSLVPGSVLLAKAGDTGMPLLAVRQAGEGRTLALMGDTSWYWSFKARGLGQGSGAYLRFWKNALRWLVGDPDEGQVQVDTDRENYRLGQRAVISVRAVGVDYAPLPDADVTVVVGLDGGAAGGEPLTFKGRTGSAGEWSQTLSPSIVGPYRVTARVTQEGGAEVGDAETVFTVNEEGPEMKELGGDRAFLQALSEVSGGRSLSPGEEIDGPLEVRARPEQGATQRTVIPLWDKAPGFSLLFFLFGLEWLLRRRWGLR